MVEDQFMMRIHLLFSALNALNSILCVSSFASGCMALPVLMNIKQVIEQRQCSGVWTHKDELPVRRFAFTSVFLIIMGLTQRVIHTSPVLAD